MTQEISPFRRQLAAMNLTREALARLAGLSDRTLHRLEHGRTRPNGRTLLLLAKVLKISREEVITLFPVADPRNLESRHKQRTGNPLPRDRNPRENHLRLYREEQMISREELAHMAGITSQTIVAIENRGRVPKHGTISKLIKALGLPLSRLHDVFPRE